MKSTGIVRRLDSLGRIVIPVELRRLFRINPWDAVEIYLEGESVVLAKYHQACCFSGGTVGLERFRDRHVCGECLQALCHVKELTRGE